MKMSNHSMKEMSIVTYNQSMLKMGAFITFEIAKLRPPAVKFFISVNYVMIKSMKAPNLPIARSKGCNSAK